MSKKASKNAEKVEPVVKRHPRTHNKSNGRGTINPDVQASAPKFQHVLTHSGNVTGLIIKQTFNHPNVILKPAKAGKRWVQLAPSSIVLK